MSPPARGEVSRSATRPGVLTDTTADLAWALLMAAARRVAEGDRYVRDGRWKTWGPLLLLGPDVHGATIGIVGFGRIGQAVARRAAGFGMRILYHDVHELPSDITEPAGRRVPAPRGVARPERLRVPPRQPLAR